jgi:hypothetical protein
MATRLLQSIASGAVGPGAQVVLNHSLNVQGRPELPDFAYLDNSDFDVVAATTTTVTLQNDGAGSGSCNVALEIKHTISRALGGSVQNLSPRPFVVRGGTAPASGVGIQSFRYTCTGAEAGGGADFFVALPAARSTDQYTPLITLGSVASAFAWSCPDTAAGDRTVSQFRVLTSAAVVAGDQLDIIVVDR